MKTIVITGSTRGIGLGLAEAFLEHGCRVIISARHQDAVEQCVARLRQQKPSAEVFGIACDVTVFSQVENLWLKASRQFGPIDIWINNAGMSIARKPLWEQSADAISQLIDTNLTGLIYANKVAVAGMLAQGRGQIWNMEGFGSNGAVQPGMSVYGASKRAVRYINASLQKALANTPVQVCTLSPGIVVTDLLMGDYTMGSAEWERAKRIFNILGDTVDTVAPWLAQQILNSNKNGAKVVWLTPLKAMRRFMFAAFNKRDLFRQVEASL